MSEKVQSEHDLELGHVRVGRGEELSTKRGSLGQESKS